MTVNGMHGWPNGWHRGELHELDCIGPLCRCERVLRVVETRDHPPASGRSASSRVIR